VREGLLDAPRLAGNNGVFESLPAKDRRNRA